MIALLLLGALQAGSAQALTAEAADGSEDRPVTITVTGSSAGASFVFAYVSGQSRNCQSTAAGQESMGSELVISAAVSEGPFELSGEYRADRPGRKTICAYLTGAKNSTPDDNSKGSFEVESGRAYTPLLRLPGNGALAYEKPPTLIWDKGPGRDTLRIYRGSTPRAGYGYAKLETSRPGASAFAFVTLNGERRARFQRKVPYGVYSWTVTRRDPRVGTERVSPVRRFRVGPAPLKRLVVKLRTRKYNSIKKPGRSKVTISSAPYARVRMTLKHGGRTVYKRSFREGRSKPKSRFSFAWRCSATGSFKLKVLAKDRYGNRRRESVRWNVSASRCAAMKRRAEEKRREREEKDSGSPNGSCTPGYSPCLPPASDYDCAGGSGDGPEYVTGPVYVSGDDPYDLDSDGDGVGCE